MAKNKDAAWRIIHPRLNSVLEAKSELMGYWIALSGGETTEPAQSKHLFIPTDLQERLLQALYEKGRTADSLQEALKCDRKQLYRDGINPLKKEGLIDNVRGVGYYRLDAPPPKYAKKLSRH